MALYAVLTLACALTGAQQAYAASVWDNVIEPTTDLTIATSSCTPETVTTSWTAYFMNDDIWQTDETTRENAQASYNAAINSGDGAWAIVQATFDDTNKQIQIWWHEDKTHTKLTWDSAGGERWAQTDRTESFYDFGYQAYLAFNGSCEPRIFWSGESTQYVGYENWPGVEYNVYVLINVDLNLPENYEGILPPDEVEPPIPPSDWAPNWGANVLNFEGRFFDQNFFTFDEVPFTCDGGLAPVIDWEFYDESNVLIDSGLTSATAEFTYRFNQGDYLLRGKYLCGEEDPLQFDEWAEYEFTITENGNLDDELFLVCITDTFPFVDIPACLSNMQTLINLLSFGAVSLPVFPDPTGCHTLGTIGDWLNVNSSSRTICPAFDASIRNTVTPFVTFIAGITVLAAITIKSKREVV